MLIIIRHPYLLIHQTFDLHHLSACQRGTDSTRTDIHAQLQLGHHLLSIPPHFANLMHSNSGASSLFTTILQTMLFTPVLFCFCSIHPHCPVSTGLCQRTDRLLLTRTVRDYETPSDIIHHLGSKFLHSVANREEDLVFTNHVREFS